MTPTWGIRAAHLHPCPDQSMASTRSPSPAEVTLELGIEA